MRVLSGILIGLVSKLNFMLSRFEHAINVITSDPELYSRRVVVNYKRKYVHKLLVNRLLKPVQEKVWLSGLTVPQ